jgi:hypothetical protein
MFDIMGSGQCVFFFVTSDLPGNDMYVCLPADGILFLYEVFSSALLNCVWQQCKSLAKRLVLVDVPFVVSHTGTEGNPAQGWDPYHIENNAGVRP